MKGSPKTLTPGPRTPTTDRVRGLPTDQSTYYPYGPRLPTPSPPPHYFSHVGEISKVTFFVQMYLKDLRLGSVASYIITLPARFRPHLVIPSSR